MGADCRRRSLARVWHHVDCCRSTAQQVSVASVCASQGRQDRAAARDARGTGRSRARVQGQVLVWTHCGWGSGNPRSDRSRRRIPLFARLPVEQVHELQPVPGACVVAARQLVELVNPARIWILQVCVQGIQRVHLPILQLGDELLSVCIDDAYVFASSVVVCAQAAAFYQCMRLLRIVVQLPVVFGRSASIVCCHSMKIVCLDSFDEIHSCMDKQKMSRRSTNPTLAEAVAYCVTEAVSRFTEYITPVTAKIVKRPGPKTTEIIPHETIPEDLKQ